MLHKGYRTTYDFARFEAIRNFGDAIRNGMISTDMRKEERKQLAKRIKEFTSNIGPRSLNMKKEKECSKWCNGTSQKKRNGL